MAVSRSTATLILALNGLLASLSGCTRPILPTLSLHAVLILHQAASDANLKQGHDLGLQARLAFRARREPHLGPRRTTRAQRLPMLPNCGYTVLCEWQQLSEESALFALGVMP